MDPNQVISQLTSAAIVVYALQALKHSRWCPWLTQQTKTLNRILSALGAAASAIGVHFAFDAALSANGTYVITITGLTAMNVLHGLWHVANQFCLQQLAYDAVVSKQAPAIAVTIPSSLPSGGQ